MTNEQRAALAAIANDAGRAAEDRNQALRDLGELPPLEVGASDTPSDEPAADEPAAELP